MARIPDSLRQQVIARAQGRCEYCQTQQVIVVSMEIDHIKPEAAGGETTLDNLCLACAGCNGYKLHFQSGIDPQTNQETPLFNPRTLRWREHFGWSVDGTLMLGLTPIGRATIARLHMNRDAMIESRRRWVEAGWHPPRGED
jgi:hypothetical protein